MTPHKIWIEQCEAATGIEDEFGTNKALAYLITACTRSAAGNPSAT